MKILKTTTGEFGFNSEVVFEGSKSKGLPLYRKMAKELRTNKIFDGGTEFSLPNKMLIDMWKGSSRTTLKVVFA